ncbi:MAG TPA: alpha/beta fold hydrolase [Trebonia sp.]|jgi:pimeloyl-ACP methyl ester carboxylesterase|nr:alpha/beta fold hydrolase [Trebonia sp.]
MRTQRRLISRPDGRNLDVLTAGEEGALPLVMHEGTPGGLVPYPPTVEAARQRGLRVVMIARPGYERSTPLPGRRVAAVAADVAAVLDALGADTFVSIGWSGGGPHSLACAALLPGRCLAAASVAGVAPYRAEGLDFLAGMGPENVAEFGAAVAGPDALTAYLEAEAGPLGQVTADDVAAALGGLVSEADRVALTGDFASCVAASLRAALVNGIAGWRDDDLAFVADWGFPVGPMPAPVAIWQGDQDRMVPCAHGQWLAAHIPGARVHLRPGDGHLTLTVTAIGEILSDLLGLAGLPG